MITRSIVSRLPCSLSHHSRWKLSATFSSWADVSPRHLAALEDHLCQSLGEKVVDPVLQKPLSKLNWLDRRLHVVPGDENSNAKLTLRVPTKLYPALPELQQQIQTVASQEVQDWFSQHESSYELFNGTVQVEVEAAKPVPNMRKYVENHEELLKQLGPGLVNVSQYLAVYSCKGGVGKSTVAVNLAYELARAGGRVGLLDLDIYGPSLAILVKPDDAAVRPSPLGSGIVYPLEHKGVKLLSLGYVSPKSGVPGSGHNAGAAVMRGPMAGKVVTQLVKGTDWGDLDVLVLDLPPGTGDVQLAICQELQLSGAVAVTTPSKLATEDTRKGIEMFTSLGVPTIAVVENMSYFMCEGGSKHHPFGQGLQGVSLPENISPLNIIQMPVSTLTNDANDSGAPICLTRPSEASDELAAFEQLAQVVSKGLLSLRYSDPEADGMIVVDGVSFELQSLSCSIVKGKEAFSVRLYSETGATKVEIPAADIRGRDPKTGEMLSKDSRAKDSQSSSSTADSMVTVTKATEAATLTRSSPPKTGKKDITTIPINVERKGKYGYAVEWEDGATIIYTLQALGKAAAAISTK